MDTDFDIFLDREAPWLMWILVGVVPAYYATIYVIAAVRRLLAARYERARLNENSTSVVWSHFRRAEQSRALYAIAAFVYEEELKLEPARIPVPLEANDVIHPSKEPEKVEASYIHVSMDKLLSVLPERLRRKVMKNGVSIGFPLCILRQVVLRGMRPNQFWPSLPFSLDLQTHVQRVVREEKNSILPNTVPEDAIHRFFSLDDVAQFLWAPRSGMPKQAYLVVLHSYAESHTFACVKYPEEKGRNQGAWLINSNAGIHHISSESAIREVISQDPLVARILTRRSKVFTVASIDTTKPIKKSFIHTIEW